jgi:hypothetical protein
VHDDPNYLDNDNAKNAAAKRFCAATRDQIDSDDKMEEAENYESEGINEINKQDKQRVQDEEATLHEGEGSHDANAKHQHRHTTKPQRQQMPLPLHPSL